MQKPIISTEFAPHSYFSKSLSLHHNHQTQEALAYINAAIILSNNSPFYIYQKIKYLYDSKDFDACCDFITAQLDWLYQKASLYLLCRSISYYQSIKKLSIPLLEDYLQARGIPACLATNYELLLHQSPHTLKRLIKKAIVQDQYPLALSYIAILGRNTILPTELIYLQGYAHHMLGHLEEAYKAYLAYAKASQFSADSLDCIGMVLMEMGYYNSACKYLKQAAEAAPDNPIYALHLGECYYVSQKYTLATKLYEQLHKLFPSNLQISFNLLHAYKKTHHYLQSHKYIKQIKKQLYVSSPSL